MSVTLQILLSAISGTIIGALTFSLWSAVYMYVYIGKHGSYRIDLIGIGGTLEKPVLGAFIFGAIVGGIQGFFTGMAVRGLNISELYQGALIGFAITEILILIFMISNNSNSNPMVALLAIFNQNARDFWEYSIIWLLPSIMIGAAVTKFMKVIT